MTIGRRGWSERAAVLQGTLDLMVLQTLEYTSLMRLQQRRWISSSWGASESNRKARFYTITKAGRRQLATEARQWERIAGVMTRLLRPAE
jgi:DNA-binding PadR family transcriptional regulator